VRCLVNTDCPAGQRCDAATNTCQSGCTSNAQCNNNLDGPICDTNAASPTFGSCGCDSFLNCPAADRPACVFAAGPPAKGACGVVTQCAVNNDAGENADDGPAGARQFNSSSSARTGQACYVPTPGYSAGWSMEEDWYRINVNFLCCNLYFTLSWDDNSVDYDMTIYDSNLNVVARAETFNRPEETSVFATLGDVYYVQVRIWRETASPPNFVMRSYSLVAR
jgi:Cys-rich repeat protein